MKASEESSRNPQTSQEEGKWGKLKRKEDKRIERNIEEMELTMLRTLLNTMNTGRMISGKAVGFWLRLLHS